jgi:hypothetical protein
MGTEIHTFATLKEMTETVADLLGQYKSLFEDYSQWLGSLLRTCEASHKNEEWYQKSATLQKNLRSQAKMPEKKESGKKGGGKGKSTVSSCWIQLGTIWFSSTEQGQAEILFEAIEKIKLKTQEIEKFKAVMQQLERLGLGKTVNYIVYIEDDVPKKIVLQPKPGLVEDETFRSVTELSVPGVYNNFDNQFLG